MTPESSEEDKEKKKKKKDREVCEKSLQLFGELRFRADES